MLPESEEIHFHTPAKFAGAFPYLALVAGSRVARPQEPPIRKRFHQHVFVYTMDGKGLIEVRGQRFLAETGAIAWLDTAQAYAHSCAPDSGGWRYLWMGIEGHGLDALYQFLGVQQSPLFAPKDPSAAKAAFESVSGYFAERSPATDALASAAIAGVMADMIAPRLVGAEPTEDRSGEDRLLQVLSVMRGDLARPWTIDDLAACARLSPSQFFRRFRDMVGTTPMDWLRHERINQAKRLLVGPDAKVSAVAAVCGYPDPYHFSRDFRRVTGYTPTKFRRDGGY
ncbi:helix-turn-helix transcriptional regulator [Ensifer adhaerens]|uniref:helix-turn-helix transcriptional regulator n=1 Tax=Ensifer adhaerens TaxID=106592 RepID=UPI0015C40D64|nr:AraC family transcriptional regulator [Ensifer adhaerens]